MPLAQTSPTVQTLLSVQPPLLLLWKQPVAGWHLSSLQTLESRQSLGVPGAQAPSLQASFSVQRLLSEQAAVLLLWVQPLSGSQASSVQGLPSAQPSLSPPAQAPSLQASFVVQPSPSSQGRVLLTVTQPLSASQLSAVQSLLSSQTLAAPGLHEPAAQTSSVLQTLPSLQAAVLFLWVQPDWGSQASSVHGLLSLQPRADVEPHIPSLQASPKVQALPSSQVFDLGAKTQPCSASQLSSVQMFLSSQAVTSPGRQAPSLHVSLRVQISPSLQSALSSAVWVQPLAGTHASLVQGLLSSHSTVLPAQTPLSQASALLQASPSSHWPGEGGCWQAPAMQLS